MTFDDKMRSLLILLALLGISSVFAAPQEATSSRSDIRLRSNQDSRGGVILSEGKTIAVFNLSSGAPTLFIQEQFPLSVTYDSAKQGDVIGLVVLQRPYSRAAASQIVDAIEIISSGDLRFVSNETFARLLESEQEATMALQAFEAELFKKE